MSIAVVDANALSPEAVEDMAADIITASNEMEVNFGGGSSNKMEETCHFIHSFRYCCLLLR
jgi:hypothetical protein